MMSGRLFDIMASVFDVTASFFKSFSAKRFDVNVLDRSQTEQFFMKNTVILA